MPVGSDEIISRIDHKQCILFHFYFSNKHVLWQPRRTHLALPVVTPPLLDIVELIEKRAYLVVVRTLPHHREAAQQTVERDERELRQVELMELPKDLPRPSISQKMEKKRDTAGENRFPSPPRGNRKSQRGGGN
jgi:hypothetical protein